jgi:MscS family membrane protein
VQNFTGFVERIGLRSTRLRTFDKNLVTVPNKQMVDSILDNWSMRTNQRMEIRFELSPKTPAESIGVAIEELKKIIGGKSALLTSFTVFLTEVSKNGAMIVGEYFTAANLNILEFNKLRQDIYLEAKELFDGNGIELMGAISPVNVNVEK